MFFNRKPSSSSEKGNPEIDELRVLAAQSLLPGATTRFPTRRPRNYPLGVGNERAQYVHSFQRWKQSEMEKKQVVVHLDRDLVKRISHVAVDWAIPRKRAIERMLYIVVEQVEDGLRV